MYARFVCSVFVQLPELALIVLRHSIIPYYGDSDCCTWRWSGGSMGQSHTGWCKLLLTCQLWRCTMISAVEDACTSERNYFVDVCHSEIDCSGEDVWLHLALVSVDKLHMWRGWHNVQQRIHHVVGFTGVGIDTAAVGCIYIQHPHIAGDMLTQDGLYCVVCGTSSGFLVGDRQRPPECKPCRERSGSLEADTRVQFRNSFEIVRLGSAPSLYSSSIVDCLVHGLANTTDTTLMHRYQCLVVEFCGMPYDGSPYRTCVLPGPWVKSQLCVVIEKLLRIGWSNTMEFG